ncbi:MAG TPA: TIGR00730 family Rossman fold protein [Myxococcota bacterium]
MSEHERRSAFPSAREDGHAARSRAKTPQTLSPSYRLAFDDPDLLMRDELRPVRLQLELLKPELALQEQMIESTVVVFGSSRAPSDAALEAGAPRGPDERSADYAQARRFARRISESRVGAALHPVVVTGGGPGIMEAANRGAHEAGARSIGLNIVLPTEQAPNPYVTPELSFQFHYFAIRKMHFLMRARALVCFPGGYGTLDELFETLTLIQTRKIEAIPVLLFREAWWRRIIDFEALAAEGMIARSDLDIFRFVEDADEACAQIDAFYAGSG